jgi:hypothetical protein
MKEYFSHDYSAREDEKIKALMFAHKWNGYGIYWALIETLYQNNGFIQLNYARIAFELRTDETVIDSIVNDFGLFKINGDKFTSESVLRRIKLRDEKSNIARENITKRWNKDSSEHTGVIPPYNEGNTIKVKESKEKEINNIYILYPSKCPVSLRSTGKCSKDKEKIGRLLKNGVDLESVINRYIKECTEGKIYMKNFKTFLNNIPDYNEEIPMIEKEKHFTYQDMMKPGWKR